MGNGSETTGCTVDGKLVYKGTAFFTNTRVAVYRESDIAEWWNNSGDMAYAIAPNLLAPNSVVTGCSIPQWGIDVSVELNLNIRTTPKYDVLKCVFSGAGFEPVPMATLNKVPMDVVVHANLPLLHAYVDDHVSGLLNWRQVMETVPFKELRETAGFDEVLKWALRVYAVASISGDPPTKTVAETFGVPLRTASYWVKKAKAKFGPELRGGEKSLTPYPNGDKHSSMDDDATRAATDWFIDIAYKQPMKGGE